jgi:putative ABC transport system permease protein
LGATKGHILKLVIGQGLKLTLIGAALGIGAGLALTRLIANWLYEVKPLDPLTFTIVPVLLIGVGLAASYFPAWRASKLDPMAALRHE